METVTWQRIHTVPLWTADPPFSQSSKSSPGGGFKPSGDDGKKVDQNPREDSEVIDQEKKDNVNSTNTVNAASTNEVNAVGAKTSIELPDDPNMPELEDIVFYQYDDEDVGAEADMNNLDAFIPVSPILTTRVHKDHPVEQIIGDLTLAPQTRRMIKNLKEHDLLCDVPMDVKSALLYGRLQRKSLFVNHQEFEDPTSLTETIDKTLFLSEGTKVIFFSSSVLEDCQPKLGLWYPKDSPFDLVAYTDSDYAGASLDRKSTTGGCQFLGCRLDFMAMQEADCDLLTKAFDVNTARHKLTTARASLTTAGLLLLMKVNAVRHNFLLPVQVNTVEVFLDKQVGDISTHDEIYVTPSHTKKVFGNMKRVGKGFSGNITPLFPTMTVQAQEEMGKEEQPRRKQRKDTKIPQSSGLTKPIADEAANEENNDVDLENLKLLTQAQEITILKKRVKLSLKKEVREYIDADKDITLDTTHFDIDHDMFGVHDLDSDEVFVETKEPVVNAATTTSTILVSVVKDLFCVDMTLAQALAELRHVKPKELVEGSEVRAEGSKTIAQESSLKRARDELEQEKAKKQKIDDDQEEAKMKKLMENFPNEEANGSEKQYSSMIQMLRDFDREDLETLWKLVKAKHGYTRPEEGYERVL
ncbi:hypothetical protein Tco_0327718 [Tanacetum coccineum]